MTMPLNPGRAEAGWPAAVVASAYQTGHLLMRNLSRRGVSVSCFDCDRGLPGFRERYGPAYECPDPDTRPGDWLEFMIGLARRFERRPALIPCADAYVSAIAAYARELERHFLFCRASIEVQAKLATKQSLYDNAARHGMPVPRTQYVETEEEVREFAASARFPCLIKPLHCREWEPIAEGHPLRWQKLVIADRPVELLARYRMAAEINPGVVVQEIIEGPDTAKVVYLSCYGRGGNRIASCIFRELRTDSVGFGSASVVEPASDREVDEVCDRFLRELGYVGLCEIELKRDSRDGRLLMIEANPRYTVTSDAAAYAGVDLGWLHYLDLAGRDVAYSGPNGREFRHICLARDFAAIRTYRRAGLETWGSLLRSYRPPVAFWDIDVRDWPMSASTLIGIARAAFGPAIRRFLPQRRPVTNR